MINVLTKYCVSENNVIELPVLYEYLLGKTLFYINNYFTRFYAYVYIHYLLRYSFVNSYVTFSHFGAW